MADCLFSLDLNHAFLARQKRFCLCLIQSSFASYVRKGLQITDVLAFQKIRTKESLHHYILFPLLCCIPDQPMSRKSVRRPLNLLEGKRNLLIRAGSEELFFHPAEDLQAPKLGFQIGGPIHSNEWHCRIQLKWTPRHMNVATNRGQCALESSLPDKAPRADDV